MHIETNNMAPPSNLSSKTINHLGLVAGMYDELEIGELIDKIIPQDKIKRVVSIGQTVKTMVINGLGFTNRAMYLTPLFFKDKPTERLIGQGINPEHLNDDLLGRSLDKLYEYGVESLYSQISAHALKLLGLNGKFSHLDSTSFHVDGKYNHQQSEDEHIIHISKGHSRDHRPDLNQVILQLICDGKAGIPTLMQPLSGNINDSKGFRDTIDAHIEQLKQGSGLEYLVGDSCLYSADTLKSMEHLYWISRVPETINLAKEAIHEAAPTLMENLEEMKIHNLRTHYADIEQRWLVVFSPQSYQRALQSVDKGFLKQTESEQKELEKLCRREFACIKDAEKALALFKGTLKCTEVNWSEVTVTNKFNGKGRPSKKRKADYQCYRISAGLSSSLSKRSRQLERKSCFVIATNQLDSSELNDQEVIDVYKNQQKVERGFRFMKDPMFMSSTLFLKSPKRIMALMMVMTLCLLVYAALEYRIRESLALSGETFPSQTGKESSTPTARWVFQYFSGIHVLIINQLQEVILNLNLHHKLLLHLLGNKYESLYSGTG